MIVSSTVGDRHAYDVIVVGGGPAGATLGTIVKKYAPELRVLILERERFPREHIGESQLPLIGAILEEMGVWDKVEAAGFPIKIGASFTWGRDDDGWDLDFFPVEDFVDEERPARFEGQRRFTSFQVERAIYDEILLDHAETCGVEVRQETQVREVLVDGDRVTGIRLASGEELNAKHYVDATGAAALFSRAFGIEHDAPTELRNIAMWDYYENAEWAVKIGVGGTRIQIRSLPYGWLWFIPLGPTRSSLGLVCPSAYYKERGVTPEALFEDAVASQPDIQRLIAKATPTGNIQTTKDWSHLADRIAGENWFMIGEAAGFADPILSAGMTLAHTSGRDAAYTIMELERGEFDADWLRTRYNDRNRRSIRQHIRFAQYWYAANSCFGDLKDHCRQIAREAGVRMTPQQAWEWLAKGGFSTTEEGRVSFGSFDLFATRKIIEKFSGKDMLHVFERYNVFKLNLKGAEQEQSGILEDGRIRQVDCYRRGDATLTLTGRYAVIVSILEQTHEALKVHDALKEHVRMLYPTEVQGRVMSEHMQALEAMLQDGWIDTKVDKKKGRILMGKQKRSMFRSTKEGLQALEERDRRASQEKEGDDS
jgi:flavin-dependent dehydrogenase